jgi:hypothetical protein
MSEAKQTFLLSHSLLQDRRAILPTRRNEMEVDYLEFAHRYSDLSE